MRIVRAYAGNSGQYFSSVSSNLSLPCSERIMIAMAVNCLVMDASSNCVSGVMARCVSRFARPKAVCQATWQFADEHRNHARRVVFPVWRDQSIQTCVDRLRLNAEDDQCK